MYTFTRFIDRYAPGDDVPKDVYTADHLARMLAGKQIATKRSAEAQDAKPAAKPTKKP